MDQVKSVACVSVDLILFPSVAAFSILDIKTKNIVSFTTVFSLRYRPTDSYKRKLCLTMCAPSLTSLMVSGDVRHHVYVLSVYKHVILSANLCYS